MYELITDDTVDRTLAMRVLICADCRAELTSNLDAVMKGMYL